MPAAGPTYIHTYIHTQICTYGARSETQRWVSTVGCINNGPLVLHLPLIMDNLDLQWLSLKYERGTETDGGANKPTSQQANKPTHAWSLSLSDQLASPSSGFQIERQVHRYRLGDGGVLRLISYHRVDHLQIVEVALRNQ